MYTTIEADIENGQLKSPELKRLPSRARVLITLLAEIPQKHPDWRIVKAQIGKLKLRGNTEDWQREMRSDWERE